MYDEDEINDSQLVKDLRKQREDAVKDLKKLQDELTQLRTQTETRSVADILASKGAAKGLARYAISDGAKDEDSVVKWLDENGSLFGFTQEEEAAPAADAEAVAAAQQVQTSTAGGQAASRTDAHVTAIAQANTAEEWTAALRAAQQSGV